jgi:D-glycero-alpha-D-manno-heptose-7-phosphate kinase
LIDEILERARRAGAKGGKALGASGGGCVLAIAGEDTVDAVRAAIAPLASLQPVIVDDAGFTATIED